MILKFSPFDKNGCRFLWLENLLNRRSFIIRKNMFSRSLYQEHWENAEAYGVVSESGEMLACIEVCPEEWSNRLVVTELWVSEELRRKGVGKRLMDKAKEVAVRQKRRAVILETQSCNTNAIGFYLHQGFELIGFDTCCYSNEDIARREVRVNLGFFLARAEE